MDLNIVNIGATYNDGTGDLLRDSFEKINANFAAVSNVIAQIQAGGDFEDADPGYTSGGISVYDPTTEYLPGDEIYVFHLNKVYKFIKTSASTGETPADYPAVWEETSWSSLFHLQNTDFKLRDYIKIVSMVTGEWDPHQPEYMGINSIVAYTPGTATITLTIKPILTSVNMPYKFANSFVFYVGQGDTNTYVFTENDNFSTGQGDITLEEGDWMIVKFMPFTKTTINPAVFLNGSYAMVGTSFRQPVEGLTPEFRMTEEGLFQYKIIGDLGWTTLFDITTYIPEGIQDAIDHAATDHSVTAEGGFQAGSTALAGAGAAIGYQAQTKDAEGLPIDAIQLGRGQNITPKTLKVYNYTLMNADGSIPEARLPTQLSRGIVRTTEAEYLVSGPYMFYMANASSNNVTFVLPSASLTPNLPFIFKLSGQESGYAMTVERSGDDVINVNGADWLGITTDVNGFWFMLVSDGSKYNLIQDAGIAAGNNMS